MAALPRVDWNDLDACYWVQTPQGVTQIPSTGAGYRAVSEDTNFAGDMRESFNLRETTSSTGTSTECGLGDNKWPQAGTASELWCQEFRAKSNEYFEVCFRACTQLRKLLAHVDCLGQFLGTDSASDEAFTRSTSESYCSQQVFGIRPHQDDGMCTLLYTDGSPGLEYAKGRSDLETDLGLFSGKHCRDDAQFSSDILWEAVPFLPGHWIVNLGTDLFRWTQQRSAVDGAGCRPCKATLHRVVPAPGATERYSMPFFYEANLDTPDPCFPYKKRCLPYEYLIEEAGDKITTRQHINKS
eukprot:Skav213300  [mRNA]  locus=scaffold2480:557606:561059:- [translate_table: standard]